MTVAEPPGVATPRYRDLREWLERVEAIGELKRISGADWQTELGAIAELNAKQPTSYALLFDAIPGHPPVEVEEGPYSEAIGYYAGGKHTVPAIEVAAVYHRRDPILVGAPPGKPPHDFSYSSSVMRSALIHDALEAAGLPGVVRVWCPPSGATRLMSIVVLRQRYFGHSKQAGLLASQVQPAAYKGRLTIVVDQDIDPEDLGELFWAITTRADPKRDYTFLDHCWGGSSDPLKLLYPQGTMYSSRVIIDACRPFEHRTTFPPVAASSPELLRRVRNKWGHLFDDSGRPGLAGEFSGRAD
jgi:3-polyprenyl-4-hydroxybenzoate decarboxylase